VPLFPDAAAKFTPLIATLAVIGIIYAALVAMVQGGRQEAGRLFLGGPPRLRHARHLCPQPAGSGRGHAPDAQSRGFTGALFLIVGFIYERRHTRLITDFGGLSKQMPVFATIFMIVTLSSSASPAPTGSSANFSSSSAPSRANSAGTR